MKQVNFKELNVEIGIDEFEKMDMRKEIGNAIHRQAITVPMADLARKIYHSEESVMISDEDYGIMLSIVSKSFALIISKAIERSTAETVEEPGRDKEE